MTSPRTLLKAWNIKAKKQLGQNFLNDPNAARAIVEKAEIGSEDVVLEIGPGLGAITSFAAASAHRVIGVDKDPQIIALLKTELLAAGIDNVELRRGDILKVSLESVSNEAQKPLVVLGNLPYNISSQVIVQLIHSREHVSRAVLMLQKEMARRICAGPGSKTYGRLSVMLGYCAKASILMQVHARQFYPAPKVDSTVIGIRFSHPPPFVADNETLLFQVVKAAFGKRRKTMRNALSKSDLNLSPATCEQILHKAEIDPMQRAEQLSVSAFVKLSNRILEHRQTIEVDR